MANRNAKMTPGLTLGVCLLLFTLVTSTVSAASCRLTEPIVAWTSPERVIALLRVYVASNGMTDQVMTMGMADVIQGNAIHVPQGTNVEVVSVTPIVSEIRVNGITLYTPSMAIKCR